MKSVILSSVPPVALALVATVGIAGKATGAEPDKQFFRSVEGKWVGPGEIVAGKYKGTKFTCSFTGSTPDGKVGMSLDGGCRVGMFTQQMSATIEHKGRQGYKGTFMGGAGGSGLDIIGGNVVDAHKVVFTINRNQLRGVMQALVPDDNSMTVTVAVRVDQQLVPVIGMKLKRVDGVEVGSIAPN
ncbi:hypothetical protein [Mesorhizobium sp. M0909]|uniref:hypothetical protein n=1 Tax=Mesorhizobium sp. M0909 TaxID=2957024 RepID=UPI00333D99B1